MNLPRSPTYIRFEAKSSGDNWNVAFAAALVDRDTNQFVCAHFAPVENLWIGQAFGKILFLTNEFKVELDSILKKGREVAARAAKKASGVKKKAARPK